MTSRSKLVLVCVVGAAIGYPMLALAAQAIFTVDTAVDQRAFTGDGDWDIGRTKAECAQSSEVTGVSTSTTGRGHSILCQGPIGGNTAYVTLNYEQSDSRRDTSTGDWDIGYFKGECASNERVVGLSEDPLNGKMTRVQCAKAGTDSQCHALVFANGDNRGYTGSGDWAIGYYKGECPVNEVVKGVSRSTATGSPHAILCCKQSFPL